MNAREGGPGMEPAPPIENDGDTKTSTDLERYEPKAAVPVAESAGAVVLATRAAKEVEARMLFARRFPREYMVYRRKILEACKRPAFADAGIYEVPRGGKQIEGLSIRFAEECARHYGNIDVSSMVVSESDEDRTIECSVVDLETNFPWRQSVVIAKTVERKSVQRGDEVLRKRQNSKGEQVFIVRANAEQVFMEQNRLLSKTIRNLILNHIPSDIKEEARDIMESTLKSEVDNDIVGARKRIVDGFYRRGVTPGMLAEFLGKQIEDANSAELNTLNKIGKGIDQGESTWDEIIREKRAPATKADGGETKAEPGKPESAKGATEKLRETLGGK